MKVDMKTWCVRLAIFASLLSFFLNAPPLHPLLLLASASFLVALYLDLKRGTSLVKLLLPFASGLLGFPMRFFYWDRFDFTVRTSGLLWLSLLFSLFLLAREFDLLGRFTGFFNALKLRRRLLIIFIAAEALFVISSYTIVQKGVKLGGDEPHYLAVAQSAIEDFDLNVFNQYFRGGYKKFIEVEKLRAHGAFGKGYKRLYSTHLPGVSITLAPFLLLKIPLPLLYFSIRAYLGIFGALLAVVVYLFSLKLWRKETLSLFLTVVFTLTAPVFFLSFHIFPELQALLLLVSSLYFLLFPGKKKVPKTLLAGFLLGISVFWGLKYLIFIFIYIPGFFVYFTVKKEYRRALALVLFPLIFQALFFYYLHFAYGNFSPMSIYTGMMTEAQAGEYYGKATAIPLKNRVETLLGYLFDQRDGLLLYSPFYFFAFPGLLIALRKFKTYWPHLALSGAGFLYVLYHGYSTVRAGYCPQGRYLVPVMWMFLLFAVIYYLDPGGSKFKKAFFLLPLYSFFLVIYQVLHPFTLYQPATHDSIHRPGLLFSQWGNLYFDPAAILPSFVKVEGNFRYAPNLVFLVLFVLLVTWAVWGKSSPESAGKGGRVSTNVISCLFLIAIFAVFFLFPRVGLYNPTLVQQQGVAPFTVYRESSRPMRVQEKKMKIVNPGIKSYTVSTFTRVEAFNLVLENTGTRAAAVEVYCFDTLAGRSDIAPGQTRESVLKTGEFKRLKKRFFYQFTLVLKTPGNKPPALAIRLTPAKRP